MINMGKYFIKKTNLLTEEEIDVYTSATKNVPYKIGTISRNKLLEELGDDFKYQGGKDYRNVMMSFESPAINFFDKPTKIVINEIDKDSDNIITVKVIISDKKYVLFLVDDSVYDIEQRSSHSLNKKSIFTSLEEAKSAIDTWHQVIYGDQLNEEIIEHIKESTPSSQNLDSILTRIDPFNNVEGYLENFDENVRDYVRYIVEHPEFNPNINKIYYFKDLGLDVIEYPIFPIPHSVEINFKTPQNANKELLKIYNDKLFVAWLDSNVGSELWSSFKHRHVKFLSKAEYDYIEMRNTLNIMMYNRMEYKKNASQTLGIYSQLKTHPKKENNTDAWYSYLWSNRNMDDPYTIDDNINFVSDDEKNINCHFFVEIEKGKINFEKKGDNLRIFTPVKWADYPQSEIQKIKEYGISLLSKGYIYYQFPYSLEDSIKESKNEISNDFFQFKPGKHLIISNENGVMRNVINISDTDITHMDILSTYSDIDNINPIHLDYNKSLLHTLVKRYKDYRIFYIEH